MTAEGVAFDGGRWYVYALIDPIMFRKTGSHLLSVLYVGKGTKDRANQHARDERKALERAAASLPMHGSKSERIRWLLGSGEDIPAVTLASGFVDENDAYRAETLAMELISRLLAAHGLEPLGNAVPGHGQASGMQISGQAHELGGPKRPALSPVAVDGEPTFELRSVRESLYASTSRRVDWRSAQVVRRPSILVKGTTEAMPSGSHSPLPREALPPSLADVAHRVTPRDIEIAAGSEFVRRGYDPDDPWTDHEARERATRYWPFAATTVREWLLDDDQGPLDLLLAVPGTGGTTVRYAWEVNRAAVFDFYPAIGRWGIPLGRALLDHPARGLCLVEDREERKGVQVLLNHVAGCRLLIP
ncbi:GIY-YIG nuclease family protein [Cellulomonas gilvus]|nr:GIY-YIG nuclease family protein [Cellulomonas gilvus]